MNSKQNLEIFINQLLETIVDNHDVVNNYHKIQKSREDLIDRLGIDIDELKTSDVVNELKLSGYKYLYQNLDLTELADVVFLHRMDENIAKSCLQKMVQGINDKNYLNNIYSYDEFYKDNYGIELNNIEQYLDISHKNQILELKSNFATFIEYYYSTSKGKEFINNYRDNSIDGLMPKEFFQEIFKKMRDSSLVPNLIEQADGSYKYKAGSGGDLDGFFVIFDDNFNMTFNVSTTASKDVSIEKTSVLRHALTSKFISEAIIKEIDNELFESNKHHIILDEKDMLKKDRADAWNRYALTDKSKNIFLHRAVMKHIKENNLNIKINYNTIDIEDGSAIKKMIKELNAQDPAIFINTVLNENGVITNKKIKKFFKTENDFNTNFVSDISGLRNSVIFSKSDLKNKMADLKIGIFDFKTFLQTSTLKNITLKKYSENIHKNAIDFFYDKILTRRVFAKINQHKINHPQFLHNAEKLIVSDFVLQPKSVIDKNKEFLNEQDQEHLNHYLKYILFNQNDKQNDIQDRLDYIKVKLKNLQIDSTPLEVLKRIKENYPDLIEKADDLIDKATIQEEKEITEEKNAKLRALLIANNIEIPEDLKEKKPVKNQNDEIDYTTGQKAISDIEQSTKIDTKKQSKKLTNSKNTLS